MLRRVLILNDAQLAPLCWSGRVCCMQMPSACAHAKHDVLCAACVSHETREYLHIKVDQLHIIIWKSKDTPFKPELVAKD